MKPETLKAWLDAAGGWQGFVITVGAGLVNAILVFFGKITSGDFVLVTGSTVSVFLGSHAWQNAKTQGRSD